MKKICLYQLIFILTFFWVSCDNRSEDEKLAHQAIANTAKALNERYKLKYIGISESGGKNYYTNIGIKFVIYRVLSKDEGRKIMIDCIKEFLKEMNSKKLLPYLSPSPFTEANIQVTISVFQSSRYEVYYPEICIFSYYQEKIHYNTKIPEKKYGYYTEEEESYEEALDIVRSQNSNL